MSPGKSNVKKKATQTAGVLRAVPVRLDLPLIEDGMARGAPCACLLLPPRSSNSRAFASRPELAPSWTWLGEEVYFYL